MDNRNASYRLATRVVLLFFMVVVAVAIPLAAQETMPSTLDKSGNNDGVLQPEEIPVNERQAIAVYAGFAGISMQKPMRVRDLMTGRTRYLDSLLNEELPDDANYEKSGTTKTQGVRGFGVPQNSRIRPFSKQLPEELATSQYHQYRASVIMRYVDANRDGYMTPAELQNSRYITYQTRFFKHDRNFDNRLSTEELSLYYYARNQTIDTEEIREKSTWTIEGVEVTPAQRAYAETMMKRYDDNGDGYADQEELPDSWARGWILEAGDIDGDRQLSHREMYRVRALYEKRRNLIRAEAKTWNDREEELFDAADDLAEFLIPRHALGDKGDASVLRRDRGDLLAFDTEIGMADENRNGSINETELREWLRRRIETQGVFDLPAELPLWFIESDLNDDKQVELAEFLKVNQLESLTDFERCDVDRDGIVTPEESRIGIDEETLRYSNNQPMLVLARQRVTSEIYVSDEFDIKDVDIQISIVKEDEDDIDLSVIGPGGEKATLLYISRRLPWTRGTVFRNSILDDEASGSIRPRPPLDRRWRPQGFGQKSMESLGVFYKKPIHGRWVFVIENNTDEACLLEGWSLLVKAEQPAESQPNKEDSPDEASDDADLHTQASGDSN